MRHFPEPHTHCKIKIEFEINFSNYAKKSDLKTATGVDASDFAKKAYIDKFR